VCVTYLNIKATELVYCAMEKNTSEINEVVSVLFQITWSAAKLDTILHLTFIGPCIVILFL